MGDVQLGPRTSLSPSDVWYLWVNNGGDRDKAPIAIAIVFSSENPAGNAGLVNDNPSTRDYSVGLWQINYSGSLLNLRTSQFGSPEALASDPNSQARAAISMSRNGTNWQAWAPDLGYQDYSRPVSDPLPGSKVANWLEANGYNPGFDFSPIALAASLLFLSALAANAIAPNTIPIPKFLSHV